MIYIFIALGWIVSLILVGYFFYGLGGRDEIRHILTQDRHIEDKPVMTKKSGGFYQYPRSFKGWVIKILVCILFWAFLLNLIARPNISEIPLLCAASAGIWIVVSLLVQTACYFLLRGKHQVSTE